MFLKNLSLRAFRNYKSQNLELGRGINLFFGDNAQGKTNLLEAVCILASLRSFRGVNPAATLSWGDTEGQITGQVIESGGTGAVGGGSEGAGYAGGDARQHYSSRRLTVSITRAGRRVMLDGKRPASVTQYLLALRVASFSAEDLFLVKEYPAHRRRFIDRSVFHTNPAYMDELNRYRSAMKQLNAALKSGDVKVIAAWEDTVAPLAAHIAIRRAERVDILRPLAATVYESVLGGGGLDINYRCPVDVTIGGLDNVADAYRALFKGKRTESKKRGFSSAGPHSDDLEISVGGREMRAGASRGQSKLALLALVLADADFYKDTSGESPVLLLDDVMSELDATRRAALLGYVAGMGQVLVTATEPWPAGQETGLSFRVTAGEDGARAVKV